MSREPSSAAHRYREALGRAGALDPPPPEPAPSKPRKGRNFRVVVPPKRGPESTREAALTKLTTTTEALTVNELALLRELRQTDADNGRTNGDTAGGALEDRTREGDSPMSTTTHRTAMTDAEAERLRAKVPDDPTPLAEGDHACPGCGVRTAPDRAEPVVTAPVYAARPDGRVGRHIANAPLTRCADCRSLRDRARALLDAHPSVRGRLGNIADEHTEAALCGLALLGVPLPGTMTEADLSALLRHLARPGAAVRWENGAWPGMHAPRPWSHVRESARADLRAAYATLLRERLSAGSPDVILTPPTVRYWEPDVAVPGGCLLCGVRAVTVTAAQVARLGGREAARGLAWQPVTAQPSALGGPRAPVRVAGHACPPCSEALASVGAVGPTALERALAAHLPDAAAQRLRAALAQTVGTVPGLVGWGALVYAAGRDNRPTPEPNREPWGHLDLSELSG